MYYVSVYICNENKIIVASNFAAKANYLITEFMS